MSHSRQSRSFWRRYSQPSSWSSTEETKSNTTKLNIHQQLKAIITQNKHKQVHQQACKTLIIRPYAMRPPPIPTAPPSHGQFWLPRQTSPLSFFPGEICIGRCPNFSFFPRFDVHIHFWGSPLGQSSPKWEKTCYAPIPVVVPNFILVGHTVYE